ncbi:trimeric intracellular cation channel family protein [Streptomyces sp. TR06-5]|uniref:trimeric intracellular cation channel family protein n=1 Tax=unclassified Streptomyces TaxID=2593676 RepID=UPI0039A33DC2
MTDWLSPAAVSEVTRVLDLAGVFANGLLGGVLARGRKLDLLGFLLIGVVSGLGGGVIRDVLLQHGPPVALTDYAYLPVAVAGSLLAFAIDLRRQTSSRTFNALDSAVLSFWAVAGAQMTLATGLGWLPAVLLGMTTAVGGGAVRDLLLGTTPGIFLGGSPLYATVALLVSGVMVVSTELGAPTLGIVAGVLLGMVLRLTALHREWVLPGDRDWRPRSALDRMRRRSGYVRRRRGGGETEA